jgi:hypothetical protein
MGLVEEEIRSVELEKTSFCLINRRLVCFTTLCTSIVHKSKIIISFKHRNIIMVSDYSAHTHI